jgi:hypothetical protein
MARRKKKSKKKFYIVSTIIAVVLLAGVGGFYVFKLKNKPAENPQSSQEKNYFEINDELAGISFHVSKKFDRMPPQALQAKNPSFIYGFLARDDASANCFVSQTKREQGGQITVGQLRDGVLEQIKKTNPDANLDEAKIIDVGENNNKGAKLKMSYTEEDKPAVQWEVAGITEKTATFAFCACPKAVVDLYQEDFDLFLESVQIK